MREFDKDGLLIADYQGKLFEYSLNANCSSLVFLRRFYKSKLALKLDCESMINFDCDYIAGYHEIEEEFSYKEYGNEKYSPHEMYWLGYFYRYIAYTRECSTKKLFSLFPPKELIKHYERFHLIAEEHAIIDLLEDNNLSESDLNKNECFKKLLK